MAGTAPYCWNGSLDNYKSSFQLAPAGSQMADQQNQYVLDLAKICGQSDMMQIAMAAKLTPSWTGAPIFGITEIVPGSVEYLANTTATSRQDISTAAVDNVVLCRPKVNPCLIAFTIQSAASEGAARAITDLFVTFALQPSKYAVGQSVSKTRDERLDYLENLLKNISHDKKEEETPTVAPTQFEKACEHVTRKLEEMSAKQLAKMEEKAKKIGYGRAYLLTQMEIVPAFDPFYESKRFDKLCDEISAFLIEESFDDAMDK